MIDSVQQMLEQRRAAIDSGNARDLRTRAGRSKHFLNVFLDSDDSDDSDAWDDWFLQTVTNSKMSQSVSQEWVINYDATVSRATFCHLHFRHTCRHTKYLCHLE